MCANYQIGVASWPLSPALERDLAVYLFRAIPVFRSFGQSRVSEQLFCLCFQIANIPFVFLTIKTRIISRFWKVFTVSGAGHCCRCDTVQDRAIKDNILILTK